MLRLSSMPQVRHRLQPKHIILLFCASLLFFILCLIFAHFQFQAYDNSLRPIITLLGPNPSFACSSQSYSEAGYIATDHTGQDISSQVIRQLFPNYIEYSVTDTDGRHNTVRRHLIQNSPNRIQITITGPQNLQVPVNSDYQDLGATATDLCLGDISNQIVTNQIDTTQPGRQHIIYQIYDPNISATIFTIRQIDVINLPDNSAGVIYLTFDDGPSDITPQILQILEQNQIKATFFVINHADAYDYLIQSAYQSGHSIGIHSYTHNYNYIYSSESAFFSDLHAIQDKVFNLTGYRTTLYRFPGGSSNTVSRFNPGIISRLSQELRQQGFRYFDWNVSGEDSGSAKTAEAIYQNVISGLSPTRPNVVLLHDTFGKSATAEALPRIIEYGKSHGYTFAPITNSTPVITHPINN